MHFTHQLGLLGELKAAAKFVELGFSIYTSISDGVDPFDFIACKDNRSIKVQVKSTGKITNRGYYAINLRTIIVHKSGNVRTSFDPSKCDILAIYIESLDIVCFIPTTILDNIAGVYLRESLPKGRNQYKSWIISDYINLSEILQNL